MNGNVKMPTLTFGEGCTYDMLDMILNGRDIIRHNGFGMAVRIWFRQGVILCALWGESGSNARCIDTTALLAWSDEAQDYTNRIEVPTDDITRLEIL